MDFASLITTFIYLLVFLIITFGIKSWLKIQQFACVPGPRPRLPFIGSNWYFFRRGVPDSELMTVVMRDLCKEYKKTGYCATFNCSDLVVMIFDPNLAVDFLKDNKVVNKAAEYDFLKVWGGQGLVTAAGNTWKNKRKLLNPTFHSNVIENYIPSMNIECESLLKQLVAATKEEFIDIRSLMSETTLNIIAMTTMGITLEKGSKEAQKYRECLNRLPTNLVARVHHPLNYFDFIFYRRELGKTVLTDLETIKKFNQKVLETRRENFTLGYESNKKQMAFLDLLLTLQAEGNQISDNEILDDLNTFLFAGHDTSSICLTFTLYLLGKHMNVQKKLIEEISSIFGDDKQRDVNKDDISRMHYTECVIKESLRLFPPIPQVGRLTSDQFSIGSHQFPKGTSVFVILTELHRSEKIYSNPDDFIPERFENASEIQSSFIPFVVGPRNCIGQRFALIEMKCILAHIFRNFEIKTMNEDAELRLTSDIIQKAIDPINIQFQYI